MDSQPNILFILSDQHTFAATGCNGSQIAHTPHLDRLARQGLNFTNCYTPSPLCVPARMSLLTGKYPSKTGCFTNSDILRSDIPTYAHLLGAAGYKTTNIGRLHSMGPDQQRGFQERLIGDHSSNWVGAAGHDLGPLADTSRPHRVSLDKSGAGMSSYELHDHDVTKSTLHKLKALRAEHDAGDHRPFLLHVGYILPHQPYVAQKDLYEKYLEIVEIPEAGDVTTTHPYYVWWRQHTGLSDVPKETQRQALAAYYALIEVMDGLIGQIMARLQELGLDENTLVVYASDHGEMMGNKGLWWKQAFFEEAAKVPLIMSWPDRWPAGEIRPQIANLCDLCQTFAALAGVDQLPDADGQNLCEVAEFNAPSQGYTFSEYYADGLVKWPGKTRRYQRMLRSGNWKYIYFNDAPPLLFDLENDSREEFDLAGDPQYSDRCREFGALIERNWDISAIGAQMDSHVDAKNLMGRWARVAQPNDTHRWNIDVNDNVLIG